MSKQNNWFYLEDSGITLNTDCISHFYIKQLKCKSKSKKEEILRPIYVISMKNGKELEIISIEDEEKLESLIYGLRETQLQYLETTAA
ncbi:MAG: hypothetical protein QNJ38_01460 [Prochloraceae cyanobacterium]|nr:hypothetical protein [Prochloraceae cyanobacterium]